MPQNIGCITIESSCLAIVPYGILRDAAYDAMEQKIYSTITTAISAQDLFRCRQAAFGHYDGQSITVIE